MVRDHQDDRLLVQQLQQFPHLAVQQPIVVADHLPIGVAGLEVPMAWVVILPEAVVDPIQADLHELEVVPPGVAQEVADHLEVLVGHGVDLLLQPVLAMGAKAAHVDRVVSDQLGDPLLNEGRVGVGAAGGVGSQETAHADALHPPGRIGRGHADDVRAAALTGHLVPDGRLQDGSGVGEAETVIGVVRPVAKAVHAQRSGILAGGHAHPGGNGDGGYHALQPAVAAPGHEPAKVGESFVPEEDLGGGAIEPDHQDLGHGVKTPRSEPGEAA